VIAISFAAKVINNQLSLRSNRPLFVSVQRPDHNREEIDILRPTWPPLIATEDVISVSADL